MSDAPNLPAPPSVRKIRLSRGVLSYRESGAGVPLFLLHGVNGDSRSWTPQFAAWAERFRVIAWDAPGYGGSAFRADSADDFADALTEFAAAVGGDRPCAVVGHSMGGVIAARCAAIGGRGRISALILSCSHVGRGAPSGEPLRPNYARRLRELQTLPPLEYGRRRAKAMTPEGADEKTQERLAVIAAAAADNPLGLERGLRMLQEADNAPLLGRIQAPTLVIAGEKDSVSPEKKTAKLLAGIPGARGIVLPNVGHAPYWEDPGGFNAVIEEFLADESACLQWEREDRRPVQP